VKRAVIAIVCLAAAPAAAEPQLQLDVGLLHGGIGYERPFGKIAVQLEAVGGSTAYLPTMGLGVSSLWAGGGARVTLFPRRAGKGLFATAAFRAGYASAENEDGVSGHGLLMTPALTIGQAFRRKTLDLRFGFGMQIIHYNIKTGDERLKANAPFLLFELVIGYRL